MAVMLGYDVAAALPELRAHAESMMVDACEITRPTAAEDEWNDAAGDYTDGAAPVVYAGKCRVKNLQPNPQAADAGETTWTADLVYVHLPVVGSGDVRDGDLVTVTASVNDASMVGWRMHVTGQHFQTTSTARRFACRLASRHA